MQAKKAYTILHRYPVLVFLGFLIIAYLPVFLPFFHLKNDLITQNLPTRFFISESLYSKTFPWWNPYINYGIPQYGDMNNGFWNPLLWIIAKVFGYNVLTITLEEMFYILIGGWGVFRIAKYFRIPVHYSIICGLSYMAGGYIIGHLQHFCWITGTAFFPYVLLFFVRCINEPVVKNFIAGGLFSFLFVSATHPGLIIGSLYFFLFLIGHLLFTAFRKRDNKRIKIILKSSVLFGFVSALLSLIVIVSYVEVLQHITRGSKVEVEETLLHPTTLLSYLSMLLPFAVHKGSFFQTDISMRNMSIGLALLPGIYFFFQKSSFRKNWVLLISFLFFVLLGAGGQFKLFAYEFLPYLGYVRLNGEFAYFTYLMLILGSVYGLQNASPAQFAAPRNPYLLLQYFFTACLLVSLLAIFANKDSIFFSDTFNPFTDLKTVLNGLSFWDLCLVSSLFQLVCAYFLKKYQPNHRAFLIVSAVNLIVATWICLPFTGLGQMPRKEVQAILNTAPKGINIPNLKAVKDNQYISPRYDSIIGSSAFFSKQIGYPTSAPYPVVLKSASSYFSDTSLVEFINSQAYLFMATDTTKPATTYDSSLVKVLSFAPTSTEVIIQNEKFKYLIFLQNNYPRWKVFLDDKPVAHITAFKSFLGVPIPKGEHRVKFWFDTSSLEILLWINVFLVCAGLIVLSQKKIRNTVVFKR